MLTTFTNLLGKFMESIEQYLLLNETENKHRRKLL